MSDPYPSTLNIEIDHDRLKNYLRAKWLLCWAVPLSLFGGFIGFASAGQALDHHLPSRSEAAFFFIRHTLAGLGISLAVALVLYLLLSHRLASRFAASLQVSVEGAFLRVRQHTAILSDRKLHFRSIVDYATTEDFLMRHFGIQTLQMTTTAGGQNTNLYIPGIKDTLRIRDLLADIDRLRENQ